MYDEVCQNADIMGTIIHHAVTACFKDEVIVPENFSFVIDNNAIIPKDREAILKYALSLGMNSQYYECLHLLVPQIENVFREIAAMCGGLVTSFDVDSGIEQAKTLRSVFSIPELQDCFDEEILFFFRAFLDEKAGANLRNRIAHGILDSNEGNSGVSVYLLFASIKLFSFYSRPCHDLYKKLATETNQESSAEINILCCMSPAPRKRKENDRFTAVIFFIWLYMDLRALRASAHPSRSSTARKFSPSCR